MAELVDWCKLVVIGGLIAITISTICIVIIHPFIY